MKTVKVTYSDGRTITTSINGNDEEILDYFRSDDSGNNFLHIIIH